MMDIEDMKYLIDVDYYMYKRVLLLFLRIVFVLLGVR